MKEMVFWCFSVHLDILPVWLDSVERLEHVKLLDVFIDSKLPFSKHVEHM